MTNRPALCNGCNRPRSFGQNSPPANGPEPIILDHSRDKYVSKHANAMQVSTFFVKPVFKKPRIAAKHRVGLAWLSR
jgi:hypothetical protein